MFSLNRLQLFLGQLWQRSPRWYAFLPFLTAIAIVTVAYYLFQFYGPQYHGSDRQFYGPFNVMMVFLWTNTVALTVISTHLIGRHLRDERSQTDFYTLPLSLTEKYTGLLLSVLVVVPLFGLLSSLFSFAVLKTLSYPVIYPRWSWLDGTFFYALIPYYLIIVPYFTLSFLRPRMTILWGIGIAVICAALIGMLLNTNQDFMETVWLDISDLKSRLPDNEGFYGPSLADSKRIAVNPFFDIMNKGWVAVIWILPVLSCLFTSAWMALKNRQV